MDSSARENIRADNFVCSDVLGPISPEFKSRYRYIVSFIAMGSRFATIHPQHKRTDVPEAFMKMKYGIDVKVLRSDNGGEYRNAKLESLQEKWNQKKFTVPHNLEQNGMAERMSRSLTEMTPAC